MIVYGPFCDCLSVQNPGSTKPAGRSLVEDIKKGSRLFLNPGFRVSGLWLRAFRVAVPKLSLHTAIVELGPQDHPELLRFGGAINSIYIYICMDPLGYTS